MPLTNDQIEKISNYFASMKVVSPDNKLAKDYRLAYLLSQALISKQTELREILQVVEAIISLDPDDPNYAEKVSKSLHAEYNRLQHNL
jgi:hypothetical protein